MMFKEPIFFGGFSNTHIELPGVLENGKIFGDTQAENNRSQEKHVEHLCGLLHERLEEGFSHLSGSQQWTPPGKFGSPSGSSMEEWTEGQDEIQGKIMAIIEDVATALGAKVHHMNDEDRFLFEVGIKKAT